MTKCKKMQQQPELEKFPCTLEHVWGHIKVRLIGGLCGTRNNKSSMVPKKTRI